MGLKEIIRGRWRWEEEFGQANMEKKEIESERYLMDKNSDGGGVVDIRDVGVARVSSAEWRLLSASSRTAFNSDVAPSTSFAVHPQSPI